MDKTVLPDTLRLTAVKKGRIWAGADMSEAASVSENKLSVSILTDLASAVSHIISEKEIKQIGFKSTTQKVQQFLNYDVLHYICTETPGLEADKLKEVLKVTWNMCQSHAKLNVIASLENAGQEFSLKDIEAAMKAAGTSVSTSAINTMLKSLNEAGLIYKTRHGIYSFAVPMFSHFIKRENN